MDYYNMTKEEIEKHFAKEAMIRELSLVICEALCGDYYDLSTLALDRCSYQDVASAILEKYDVRQK